MKTSEEMAQSVMRRAKAHRAAARKRIITAATAAACICLVLTAAFFISPGEIGSSQSASPNIPSVRLAKISLVAYAADAGTPKELAHGVTTPCSMEVRVHDIRDLSTEAAEAIVEADKAYAKELVKDTIEPGECYQWGVYSGNNAIISTICAGHFFIEIEDYKQVEDVHFTLIGTGALAHVSQVDGNVIYKNSQPKEYEMDYWRVAIQAYQTGGIGFIWVLSSHTQEIMNDDPTIPLSTLGDTITVTVNMKDGSQQTGIIDITLDDEGHVYATCRGN